MTDPAVEQPSRAVLVRWIKANMAMTAFICGGLTTAGLALWNGGGWVHDQTAQFARVDATDVGLRHAVDNGHDAIVDIDRRLNDITTSRLQTRQQIEAELNSLSSRVVILETQLKFLGDRVQQQGPAGVRR
jgi:hypothetical protein